MKLYLAGPMTGYEGFNYPHFNAVTAQLREQGHEVINPAEHGIIDGAQWADYMRLDIAGLVTCEGIALLDGWEKSRGAVLENHIATALGMGVHCAYALAGVGVTA